MATIMLLPRTTAATAAVKANFGYDATAFAPLVVCDPSAG